MKSRISLKRPGSLVDHDDVVVDADVAATVQQVALQLLAVHPLGAPMVKNPTLVRHTGGRLVALDPQSRVGECALRSGSVISINEAKPDASGGDGAAAAVLTVVTGPESGRRISLPPGASTIGRSTEADLVLPDPLMSRVHARILVSDAVEISDLNSSNGVIVAGQTVTRTRLQADDEVLLGDTVIKVRLESRTVVESEEAPQIEFNRSPVLQATHEGTVKPLPEPPQRESGQRFPLIALLAPLMMGFALFAVTRSALSLMFIALSPVMMIGQWVESRVSGRRSFIRQTEAFRADLALTVDATHLAQDTERIARLAEHPAGEEVAQAATSLSPLLWSRRPDGPRWAEVRLGLGQLASRNTLALPSANRTTAELWAEMASAVEISAQIDEVPFAAALSNAAVGIAGLGDEALACARSVVLQLTGLHSPAEMGLAVISSARNTSHWDWVRWLPHVGGESAALRRHPLTSTEPTGTALVAELEELIAVRSSARSGDTDPWSTIPHVLVVIDDDCPVERSRLVGLAERGPALGVLVLWVAGSVDRLPAACGEWLHVTSPSRAVAFRGREGIAVPIAPDLVDLQTAETVARRLAPVLDSGAKPDLANDLPARISLLTLSSPTLAHSADAVLDRWRETRSLPEVMGVRLTKDNTLRALVGVGPEGPIHLDLREQGPHALVGGTTGSGKSEFLQTWILGMATAHSPARVAFLLVDYKGGAAFAECVNLPHTVGLVTDLSPHLVRRALTSLRAELRYRERLLHSRDRAKDLLSLEREGDSTAPPSLVIVVDEFAALAKEVPEFVDGVVDVAQRGRSLGLHLVLATQRPAGVIRDSLRTNTNLRVALRMNDESDSMDVVGTAAAATFDPGMPGRGVVRVGPGRLLPFQAAYVGGRTPTGPVDPSISVETLSWDLPVVWRPAEPPTQVVGPSGPTDIARVVRTVGEAFKAARLPEPRKPWLPVLPAVIDWAWLVERCRFDPKSVTELVFGMADDPDHQQQGAISFIPDRHGAMAVFGTGGTGKSTLLRTLASAAGWASQRGDRTIVYGLDFATGALAPLEQLPNVASIIKGDDDERVARLVSYLRDEVDERVRRFVAVNASSLGQYRSAAEKPLEPRILVLVDGIGTFWQDYQETRRMRHFEDFTSVVLEGRSVGVHVVMTADRPAAIPSHISSSVQRRVLLRQANDNDEMQLGIPTGVLSVQSPPGRGFVDGHEVQIAVIGGSADTTVQAHELGRQGADLRASAVAVEAEVGRLPERIRLMDLAAQVGGRPVIGVADSNLQPVSFEPSGAFLIAGPPRSGVTTATFSVVASLLRVDPRIRLLHLGVPGAELHALAEFDVTALAPQEWDGLVEAVRDPDGHRIVLVIEDLLKVISRFDGMGLDDLIASVLAGDGMVVASGEVSTLIRSFNQPLKSMQAHRSGLLLQPDTMDEDLLKVSFPRSNTVEFTTGRAILAQGGRASVIQVATPD